MELWRWSIRSGVFGDDGGVSLVWADGPESAEAALRGALTPTGAASELVVENIERYDAAGARVLVSAKIESGTEAEKVFR